MDALERLNQQAADVHKQMSTIEAAVDAACRTMTEDEQKQMAELQGTFTRLTNEIELRKANQAAAAKLSASQPRITQPTPNPANLTVTAPPTPGATTSTPITGGNQVAHNYANHGFQKGFGEFLMAVRNVRNTGHVDPRLVVNAVSTFGGEQVGADGGYALPPQFSAGILEAVSGPNTFLSALSPTVTNSNLLVVPTDETAPWSSTGITAAATAEGATITATKPSIKQVNVQLWAAKALVHVSDENLQDVAFLSSYVMRKMGTKLRYLAEDWLINGSGSGMPLGFANAPGLVTVAKEGSQTRSTTPILPANLAKMVQSLFSDSMSRYVWVMNPTCLASIWTMATSSTGYPLYLPDFKQSPGGLILGRPAYLSEACQIGGAAAGDIFCFDPEGYIVAQKAEQIQTASTIAMAFDQGLQSFRATLRIGGAPVLQNKIARAKSASSYIGHIVALGV